MEKTFNKDFISSLQSTTVEGKKRREKEIDLMCKSMHSSIKKRIVHAGEKGFNSVVINKRIMGWFRGYITATMGDDESSVGEHDGNNYKYSLDTCYDMLKNDPEINRLKIYRRYLFFGPIVIKW